MNLRNLENGLFRSSWFSYLEGAISYNPHWRVNCFSTEPSIHIRWHFTNGTFTVVLDSQPTSAVTITLLVTGESGEPGKEVEVIVTPNVLVFNDQTWSVPQQVVLTAYNDADYEGRYGFTQAYSRYIPQPFAERIVLAVSSEDRTYSNILIGQNEPEGTRVQYVRDQSIEVTVIDDDGGCLSEYKSEKEGLTLECAPYQKADKVLKITSGQKHVELLGSAVKVGTLG